MSIFRGHILESRRRHPEEMSGSIYQYDQPYPLNGFWDTVSKPFKTIGHAVTHPGQTISSGGQYVMGTPGRIQRGAGRVLNWMSWR